jgi:hypothetical protein
MSLTSRGLRAVTKLTSMASLLFRLRGRSPHNGQLLIGPGRGRPSLLRLELALFSPRPSLPGFFVVEETIDMRPTPRERCTPLTSDVRKDDDVQTDADATADNVRPFPVTTPEPQTRTATTWQSAF